MTNRRSEEKLSHFSCGECRKWWSIGDAPKGKRKWFCPWCGREQAFTAANEGMKTVRERAVFMGPVRLM